jgi:hypothetical protein
LPTNRFEQITTGKNWGRKLIKERIKKGAGIIFDQHQQHISDEALMHVKRKRKKLQCCTRALLKTRIYVRRKKDEINILYLFSDSLSFR